MIKGVQFFDISIYDFLFVFGNYKFIIVCHFTDFGARSIFHYFFECFCIFWRYRDDDSPLGFREKFYIYRNCGSPTSAIETLHPSIPPTDALASVMASPPEDTDIAEATSSLLIACSNA